MGRRRMERRNCEGVGVILLNIMMCKSGLGIIVYKFLLL
jgi:hypothetical protein